MKVFAVVVVLAVLSGCHGRTIPTDESVPQWETAVDTFVRLFVDMSARDLVKEIRKSHVSKELDKLIEDAAAEWAVYQDSIQNNVAPVAQDEVQRLGQDLQLQAHKLRSDMEEARDRIAQYAHELHTLVEHNADDIRARLHTYTRKLKKRLSKDKEELNMRVASYLEELQSRTSDKVESMKTRVEPYLAQMRENTQTQIGAIEQLLQSQVEVAKDQLQSTALRVENLRANLADKVAEIRDWFESYTDIFGDR